MKRNMISLLSAGVVAAGSGYLATPVAAAGTEAYDACMSWCMQDYMFMTCHNTCKEYLSATEEPVESEAPEAN